MPLVPRSPMPPVQSPRRFITVEAGIVSFVMPNAFSGSWHQASAQLTEQWVHSTAQFPRNAVPQE